MSKSATLPIDSPTQAISIQLTNLAPKDARFLTEVIRLFCDPDKLGTRECFRHGLTAIRYGADGAAIEFPVP